MTEPSWVAVTDTQLDPEIVERAARSQDSMSEPLAEFRAYRLDDVSTATSRQPEHVSWNPPPADRGVWVGDTPSPISALLDRYATGAADPVDDVAHAFLRLDETELDQVVVTLRGTAARREAEQSRQRWKLGTARPLEGLPIVVKDNIAVADSITAAGSERLSDWVPDVTADAVANLVDLGAIVIAKSALPEWGFGDARPGSQPSNPWSNDHWTGGSSSGSAVAIARGLVPLAVGTDSGGSIRVPSSYCGVVGFKPTHDTLPTEGVVPVSWTLDHIGPIAATALDAAIGFVAMSGALPDDRSVMNPRRELDGEALSGLRIGLVGGWNAETCTPDVIAARDATAHALGELGADVDPVELPHARVATTAAWVITVSEFASIHHDRLHTSDDYTSSAQDRLVTGHALSAADYIRARRIRSELRQAWSRLFDTFDLLLTPGSPAPAPRIAPEPDPIFMIGERMWMEGVSRNFIGVNLIGAPAIVLPVGHADGPRRPTSIQLVAPPGHDRLALSVATALEARADVVSR